MFSMQNAAMFAGEYKEYVCMNRRQVVLVYFILGFCNFIQWVKLMN